VPDIDNPETLDNPESIHHIMKPFTAYRSLFTVCCSLLAAAPCARAEIPAADQLNETKLVEIIQRADASDNDKVTACQNLGWCGTQNAIAPLAALLASDKPHLRHAARYGLETIPAPAVVDALCDAAGKLSGPALVGVLQSLGNRGSARAVTLLAQRATDADAAVSAAAVQALGKLATPEAMAALKAGLGKCPLCAEAYLNGAGKIASADPAKAAACYADLRNTRENITPSLRLAALRGEIATAGDTGLKLWQEAIASADSDTADAALRAVLDTPKGAGATAAFAAALATAPAAVQTRLATVLGQRGDKAAVPALAALARGDKAASPASSLAAGAALAALNDPAAMPPLMALTQNADAAIADAAKNEIMGFAGKAADDAVLAMMADADAATRLAGIDMAMRRRMTVAVPSLVKLANDADAKILDAAVRGLGDLGSAKEIPAILAAIKKDPKSEIPVRALSSLCSRYARPRGGKTVIKSANYGNFDHNLVADVTENVQKLVDAGSITIQSGNRLCSKDGFGRDPAPGKPKTLHIVYTFDGAEKSASVRENDSIHLSGVLLLPEAMAPLSAAYQAAQGEEKSALFKVLAALGNDQALAVAREAAAQTADAALRETAIRALADWKTPDALEDTAALAQNAPSDRLKILALRGFIRQLEDAFTISNTDKIPRLNAALAWATRDEDKALVNAALKAVGGLVSEEGFTPIFDGKSLAGWKGGGGFFEVKDGILQGQTFEGKIPKQTSHLIWTGGQPADFDLRLEFKLSPQSNSGIQIRSKDQEFGDNAYQADMNGGGNYVGFLYHPRQHLVGERGKKVTFKADDPAKKPSLVEDIPEFKGMNQKAIQDKLFMADVWNELRIVAKGPTVTLYINGMKAQETTDPRAEFLSPSGAITLQVHPGPPMKAQFRNLRIKTL
jgi:HEAT repeat protein